MPIFYIIRHARIAPPFKQARDNITPYPPPYAGFSLLDVLITLAILGILALVALPSYQNSIHAARRGDAKAELLRLAQAQAKWRANNTLYATLEELGGGVTQDENGKQHYIFAVTANTASAFTITATPTSTDGQNQDDCAALTINQDLNITSSNSTCLKP